MTQITDFGGRGGLPVLSDNNPPPSVDKPRTLLNREIGDIIVSSLETLTEKFEDSDVPVNQRQITKAVTEGINNSDLVKEGKTTSGTAKGRVSSEKTEDYYQKKKQLEYEDYLKRREKAEQEERKQETKRRETEIKKHLDETFSNLNQWSNNPLRGFDMVVDKGKDIFSKVMSTELPSFKRKDKSTSVGEISDEDIVDIGENPTPDSISKLINDTPKSASVGEIQEHKEKNPIDDLLKEQNENHKEDVKIGKINDKKQDERDKKSEKHNKTVGTTLLGLVTTTATIGIGVPLITSGIESLISNINVGWTNLKADGKSMLGENGIIPQSFKEVGNSIESFLTKHFVNQFKKNEINSLEEQIEEIKTLQNEKDISAYYKINGIDISKINSLLYDNGKNVPITIFSEQQLQSNISKLKQTQKLLNGEGNDEEQKIFDDRIYRETKVNNSKLWSFLTSEQQQSLIDNYKKSLLKQSEKLENFYSDIDKTVNFNNLELLESEKSKLESMSDSDYIQYREDSQKSEINDMKLKRIKESHDYKVQIIQNQLNENKLTEEEFNKYLKNNPDIKESEFTFHQDDEGSRIFKSPNFFERQGELAKDVTNGISNFGVNLINNIAGTSFESPFSSQYK